MTASEAMSLIGDYVGDQDLQPDEAQDQRDRLVDVAEAAHEQVNEGEEGAEAEQRKGVRGPDHAGVARHREGSRDRVDRECDVGQR